MNDGAKSVRAYARAQIVTVLDLEDAARSDEPDAVHRMRVAIRRLRSTQQTFADLLDGVDPNWGTGQRRELARLARALGRARDGEVHLERIGAALAGGPPERASATGSSAGAAISRRSAGGAGERIVAVLRDRHRAAHARLVRHLDRSRHAALREALAGLDRALAAPPVAADRPVADQPDVRAFAAIAAARAELVAAVASAGDARPGERDHRLHEARKAAKRLRYGYEALATAYGERAAAGAEAAEELQTVLGEHQDAVVLRGVLAELGTVASVGGHPATATLLTWLRRNADVHARSARDDLARAWRRLEPTDGPLAWPPG